MRLRDEWNAEIWVGRRGSLLEVEYLLQARIRLPVRCSRFEINMRREVAIYTIYRNVCSLKYFIMTVTKISLVIYVLLISTTIIQHYNYKNVYFDCTWLWYESAKKKSVVFVVRVLSQITAYYLFSKTSRQGGVGGTNTMKTPPALYICRHSYICPFVADRPAWLRSITSKNLWCLKAFWTPRL